MLIAKGVLRALSQTAVLSALLLIPAGTWHWPRAIQFLVLFGLVQLVSTLALARLAPASLEARVEVPAANSQPVADRVVALALAVSLVGWLVFIPIDVFRLRLLPAPPLWVAILGAVLLLTGYGIMLTALVQNAFAAPIVTDQSERGQVLIDSGLLGVIRHPLYLGALLFFLGIGLWLESYASVLALPLGFAPFVARIFVEERTLRETLPGYTDYMRRVRFRLIPFVW
jgi:protein-S-isoprenylcysteine O-methyltransferase Ste14